MERCTYALFLNDVCTPKRPSNSEPCLGLLLYPRVYTLKTLGYALRVGFGARAHLVQHARLGDRRERLDNTAGGRPVADGAADDLGARGRGANAWASVVAQPHDSRFCFRCTPNHQSDPPTNQTTCLPAIFVFEECER